MPAAVYYQIGLSLVISAVLIGLGISNRTRVISVFLSLSYLIVTPILLIPYPWLRWNGIVLFPLLLLCFCLKVTPRIALGLCALPLLIVLGYVTHARHSEVAVIDAKRVQFPVESIASRLKYETRGTENHTPVTLPANVLAALQEQDQAIEIRGWNGRLVRLRRLHEESYRDFIATSGFGFERTRPPSLRSLELPTDEPVPIPNLMSSEEDYLAEREASGTAGASKDVSPETLEEGTNAHRSASWLFLDVRQWGHVVDREHVVGFQPHHIAEIPHTGQLYTGEIRRWKIAQLELVSLLKYETPRVYVSSHLPDLRELAEVTTRKLNSFESMSLPQLEEERNLVIEDSSTRIRMLGALRASTSCLECHHCSEGALLGAFSYVLVRADQLATRSSTAGQDD